MMKVALHNLGCKVNSYETDAMTKLLYDNGYEIVPFEPGADVYVINTCTVTNIADRKSRQMLHKAKKMNPEAVVVAVGCYVQAAGEELKKDEAIDIVVGNNRKQTIVEVLENYFAHRDADRVIDIAKDHKYEEASCFNESSDHVRAFIKIQDGCNQFCSYCIIPYARGRVRSRAMEDIEREVKALAEKGYKEIVLTGIHLSSYGKDFDDDVTLIDAIKACSKIDGIERIRLGSLEPRIIDDEFIETLADDNKICPHFHLSLQSGCDETLKRMNRKYSADEYYDRCEVIRRKFPYAAITTDVIVGFPGETEEEFKDTEKFLEKVNFAEMHIFKYSRRNGTVAASMKNQVDDRIKSARSDELISLQNRLHREFEEKFIGREMSVLVEEMISVNGKAYHTGYSKEYVKVIFESDENLENTIVTLRGKMLITDEKSGEQILLAEM